MWSTLRRTNYHSISTQVPRVPSRKEELALGMLDPEDFLEVAIGVMHQRSVQGSWKCKKSAWELVGKALAGDFLVHGRDTFKCILFQAGWIHS